MMDWPALADIARFAAILFFGGLGMGCLLTASGTVAAARRDIARGAWTDWLDDVAMITAETAVGLALLIGAVLIAVA